MQDDLSVPGVAGDGDLRPEALAGGLLDEGKLCAARPLRLGRGLLPHVLDEGFRLPHVEPALDDLAGEVDDVALVLRAEQGAGVALW